MDGELRHHGDQCLSRDSLRRFYVLDMARALPSEGPGPAHLRPNQRAVFFRLLRSELLLKLKEQVGAGICCCVVAPIARRPCGLHWRSRCCAHRESRPRSTRTRTRALAPPTRTSISIGDHPTRPRLHVCARRSRHAACVARACSKDVQTATRYLLDILVPKFAKWLDTSLQTSEKQRWHQQRLVRVVTHRALLLSCPRAGV
jgi:hypothetical protein